MPPKKKIKAKDDAPQAQQKQDLKLKPQSKKESAEQLKSQSKPQQKKYSRSDPPPTVKPIQKISQSQAKTNKQQKQPIQQKILLTDQSNLSQAELLKRRQLRFNVVGTQITTNEAEKIKLQRLQKFGGEAPVTQQDIQKRKLKFGGGGNNNQDDQDIVKKRLDKFGGNGNSSININEDKDVLDQRKKKFGNVTVSLDDQIQKSKSRGKDFKRHQPFYRDNRFGQSHKRFKR